MSQDGLRATELLVPGALFNWIYRLSLPGGGPSDEKLAAVSAAVKAALPDAGFEIRTRKNVSPEFSRGLERFSQFLTLVGLTSLIIGGVGIANAITVFVERKKPVIATLKALGATGGRVFAIMLTEVMLMAAIGMAAGIAIGSALPFVLDAAFSRAYSFSARARALSERNGDGPPLWHADRARLFARPASAARMTFRFPRSFAMRWRRSRSRSGRAIA